MAEDGNSAGDQKGGSGDASTKTITITTADGEKALTQDEVQNLVNQSAGVAERSKEVASITKAAEKYGTDVDTLLYNSEAALGVVSGLMEKGILDDQGRLVEKKEEPIKKDDEDLNLSKDEASAQKAEERTIAIVAKVLKPELEKIGGRIDGIDSGLTSVFRKSVQDEIQKKYPTLSGDDVSQVFGAASKDQKRDIWDHAKEMVGTKEASTKAVEEAFAKKHGLDFNALNEQSAEGGGAPSLEGVKLVFKDRHGKHKGDKLKTPGEAFKAFMDAQARARA